MKGTPVDELVYSYMFPKPRTNDPQSFQSLLSRYLVAEVRSETQAFYGHLDTQEAKYPGLDYNNPTHRIRLCRFPWHRRLFRAFDGLGLTPAEISSLTQWGGTKWAKEKYEAEQGITIRDTAADGIAVWDDALGCAVPNPEDEPEEVDNDDDEVAMSQDDDREAEEEEDEDNNEEPGEGGDDAEEASEPEVQSIGIELNARLRAGAARREAGDTTAVMDEEWEQWLKNIVDSGLLHENMSEQSFHHFFESTIVPAGLVPVEVMSAARAGNWSEVPEFLHTLLRRTLEAEQRGQWAGPSSSARGSSHASTRAGRAYSELRLPVGEPGASRMTANTPGA